MKNKFFKIIGMMAVIAFITPSMLFTQNNKPVAPNTQYYAITPDGNQNNVTLTTQPAPVTIMSPEENQLLSQLRQARLSNNTALAKEIQDQLNKLHGITTPSNDNSPQSIAHGGPVKQSQGSEPDYNVSQINNLSIFGNAVATVPAGYPNAGRIFVVTSQYGPGSADSLKWYYSDNGGASWTYFYIVYFNFNWDYLNDDMDMVVVNDGAGNIWLWTTGSYYNYGTSKKETIWIRFNATTGANLYAVQFFYPGYTNSGNNYYCQRVATDNSVYTGASYVYFVCSFDSLYNGTQHYLRQKYAVCENPFAATPTIIFNQPTNGGFYWNASGAPANIRLFSDIGYYSDAGGTGADRIMTVYSDADAGFNSMYLAWSDNYGSSVAGNMVLSESASSYGARIAFNGGNAYRTGMITYTRQFGGTDWDPYYQNTTTGGTTTGSWSAGYIDASSNRCRSTDIVAIRGANNLFRTAYAQDNPTAPTAFSNNWTGSSWGTIYPVSSITLDTTYGKPRAGYTTGTDNCLTIYTGGPSGINVYASRLCTSTTGIGNHNNGIPNKYSLLQNYPNPFNPTTSIKFALPKSGFVNLVIYDITGKVVTTLLSQQLNAGSYDYSFDASNLASGVYFYKISANDFVDTKKMVLVK